MARSRSRSSSSRPSTRTAPRPAPAASHAPAAYNAGPPAHVAPQQRQPGMMAQMAATAGSVAVGSAVGHTIGRGLSGMLFGNGSEQAPAPEAVPQNQYGDSAYMNNGNNIHGGISCEADSRAFLKCMETSNNDVSSCQFYLDMLKQCQAAATTSL